MILVFGILGLVTCPVFGIVAWILGNHDLREMDAGRMDASGRVIINGGRICGIVATVLLIVYAATIWLMAILMLLGFFATMNGMPVA